MNITVSAHALEKLIEQGQKIVWIQDQQGLILWMSLEASRFLSLDRDSSALIHAEDSPLMASGGALRGFVNPAPPLDKIASVRIDGRYYACRREYISATRQFLYSILSDLEQDSGSQSTIAELADTKEMEHSSQPESLSAQIDGTLEVMGSVLRVDRAYVFIYDGSKELMSNTSEWVAEGITPEKENLQELPSSTFPWWQKRLEAGLSIIITDLADLPEEAAEEKTILTMQGIQSILVLPIEGRDGLYGFIGFDSVRNLRDWSSDEVHVLTMYSKLVASLLDNERLLSSMVEVTQRTERLFTSLSMPVLICDTKGSILSSNVVWTGEYDRSGEKYETLHEYVASIHRKRFEQFFDGLVSNRRIGSSVLVTLSTGMSEGRQVQVYGMPFLQEGQQRVMILISDVTQMLAIQSDAQRLLLERNQTYLRFADVFCRLYDRFDFDWPDHYAVAKLSLVLGSQMGLTSERMAGLYIASLLHDIGKIMLPKHLLLKNERLSEEERKLVRGYLVGAADILKQIDFPWPVGRIIREQFEHADGSGYPQGLTEKDILLESQILFVSSMFSSLTESQQYRKPYPVSQALEFMSERSGSWFSVELFEALKRFVDDNMGRIRFIKRSLDELDLHDYITFS